MSIDLSSLLPYLKSTSNLALSCICFNRLVRCNGFPILTSEAELCLENYSFYKYLDYPNLDEWLREEVFRAIKSDKSNQLKLLLAKRANIEAKDRGHTALRFCALNSKINCLKLLLQNKADIEAKDKNGYTPLMCAAWNDRTECLKVLLQNKAEIEAKDIDGYTPLMCTARLGGTGSLKLLIEKGAIIEDKSTFGGTALVLAARYGKTACLKLLLEHGAQVDPWTRDSYPGYAHLWPDSTL